MKSRLQKSRDAAALAPAAEALTTVTDDGSASRVTPPAAVVQLITGRWAAQIVGLAAELGLADHIQTGPKTADEIAAVKGLHAPTLHRLLRALASLNIFVEQENGRFAQTPMSDVLRSDVPYSLRGFARFDSRPYSLRSWMEIGVNCGSGIRRFPAIIISQLVRYGNAGFRAWRKRTFSH